MAGYTGPVNAGITAQAQSKEVFAVTTSTTAFSFAHDLLSLQVFHNGIRLVKNTDYSANGVVVTLTNAAINGDQVVLISNPSFQVADAYTRTEADAAFLKPASSLNAAKLTGALPAISGANLTGLVATFSGLSDTTVSTSDPALNTNPSSGVGHIWANKTSGEMYILKTATANSNVWVNVGDGSGAIEPFETTGGTKTTSGSYTYHTFTSSGTFAVVGQNRSADYLIVAGGGGGGGNGGGYGYYGGGGGAGGLIQASTTISTGSYAITVGAGGVTRGGYNGGGGLGVNSSFASLTAAVGGGGGGCSLNSQAYDFDGTSGGSGGGGGAGGEGANGTSGQGKAGGDNPNGAAGGGGGGGAGAAASNGGTYGGEAGNGLDYSAWATATSTGDSGYYAGGGAGGPGASPGGDGGGASSIASGIAANAQVNTGGGGAGNNTNVSAGSNGASGILIIRYLT